jgi:GTP-binding protein YchF
MGFSCGIIGLPNVGKSTIFNALTAGHAPASNYPFCTIEPNIGIVAVPDERLSLLSEWLQPPETKPTTLEFRDIAGLVEGAHIGRGRGNEFLDQLRNVDVLAHVVRCFEDPDVAHVDGVLDPVRDMEVTETELLLADLQTIERRLERVARAAKSGEKALILERDLLMQLEKTLNQGEKAFGLSLTEEEEALGREMNLLSRKPVFYVANVHEDDLAEPSPHLQAVRREASVRAAKYVVICGKIEAELLELPEAERQTYLQAYGLEQSGLERLIRIGYELLDLVTFYTVVGKELRAWTVPRGTAAPEAAGKIHSDMEKGFIRAEVLNFEEFKKAGSMQQAREEGQLRSEGRDYRIRDGDIVTFRFKV